MIVSKVTFGASKFGGSGAGGNYQEYQSVSVVSVVSVVSIAFGAGASKSSIDNNINRCRQLLLARASLSINNINR